MRVSIDYTETVTRTSEIEVNEADYRAFCAKYGYGTGADESIVRHLGSQVEGDPLGTWRGQIDTTEDRRVHPPELSIRDAERLGAL